MLKGNRLFAAILVWVAAVIGSACNCGARLAIDGSTKVVITSPTDGAQFLATDTVTFTAAADNAAGLTSLALQVGIQQLLLCSAPDMNTTHLDCTQTFTASDPNYSPQVAGGQLVLTAVAVSNLGISASVAITINIGTPVPDAGPAIWSLAFVQPTPSNGFPPSATVSAPGPLQMAINGTPSTAITNITVTYDSQRPLASFTTVPYSTTIDWLTVMGAGSHTLSGVATDAAGEMETANMVLVVVNPNCTSDASCMTGTRCCLDDGQCHPIVAENANCDCADPCPTDEGCFPGTCGKLPQQCRPGCNPGSESVPADVCQPINGVQAYCEPLPPSQVTAQNKGGACAPGDGCSVTAQNCPMAPLDPTSDAGPPTNPTVPYTCEPAGMNGSSEATVCFPAGTHPPQTNNPSNTCEGENDTCGSDTAGCALGYECVWEENANGSIDTAAGPACAAQCNTPYDGFTCPRSGSGGCPSGQFCTGLIGNGGVLFTTGVCTPLPQGC